MKIQIHIFIIFIFSIICNANAQTIFYNENGRDFIIELDNYDKKDELEKRIKEIVNTWN